MQPPSRTTTSSVPSPYPAVEHNIIKLMVRHSLGVEIRLFAVETPASGTIADVKLLLCRPPHSMCSDASTLVLVLKGEDAAAAHVLQDCKLLICLSSFHAQAAFCTTVLLSLRLLSLRDRS